jgi:hypothetical protein
MMTINGCVVSILPGHSIHECECVDDLIQGLLEDGLTPDQVRRAARRLRSVGWAKAWQRTFRPDGPRYSVETTFAVHARAVDALLRGDVGGDASFL